MIVFAYSCSDTSLYRGGRCRPISIIPRAVLR